MEEEKGISLSDIFRVIKKNIILICIIVLSVILLGGVYTFGIAKEKYRASTTIVVAVKQPTNNGTDNQNIDYNMTAKLLYTIRDLIKEEVVIGPVADENEMDHDTLRKMVSVGSVEYSFLLTIEVKSGNGEKAVELANDLSTQLIKVVDTNPSLSSFAKDTISVTSPAQGFKYDSPNKLMYMMIFTLLGAVLACVVVFVKEFASNKYTNKKDIEADLKEKVIGTFYYEKRKDTKQPKNAPKDVKLINPTIKDFESYNKLLSNIKYANLDNPIKVVASISTGPNELKSTVSCNLAYCMAHNGKKVCLIDLDLRRPVVYRAFGVSKENGLVDYVAGDLKREDLIKHSESGVDIITGGKTILNPISLIESQALADLINELREEYDYIVLDSAPLIACADSLSVAKLCDGVMFNIALKTSKKADIKEAIHSLHAVNVDKLGINVTKVPADKDNNYYYYGE